MKKITLALPLLALSFPAFAQDQNAPASDSTAAQDLDSIYDEAAEFSAEPIVINGAGLVTPIGDSAYDKVKVSAERLDDVASGRVEDALRDVAGIQQFRRSDARSANPTSQGVTLRGLGGNASSRAVLMLDGVPQADPFGGWISWPGYDSLFLNSIEVTRGGGSGASGAGALAGTIELSSENAAESSLLRGGVAYGSRNSIAADATLGGTLGTGSASISASYERGDGFIPIVAGQRGTVDRGAAYEQFGVAMRAVVPLNEIVEIQANLRGFIDNRERGFAFSDNSNEGVDASIRLVSRGDWQWSALAYAQLRGFNASFGGVAADRNSVRRVFEQFDVPSEGYGLRFELRPPVGDKAELRLGGDWRHTAGQTKENFFFQNGAPLRNRFAGGKSDTGGAFAELSIQASDAVLITGGARIDRWSLHDGFRREVNIGGSTRSDTQFANRTGWEPTGRLGLAWKAKGNLTLRTAAYLGWRLPTLNELYRPFRVGPDATAANENLVPERLKGIEAGVSFVPVPGVAEVSLTVFYNELEDAIANVTLGQGPGLFPGVGFVSGAGSFRQRQNLSEVRAAGAEFNLKIDIVEYYLNASYSYVGNRVKATGAAIAVNNLRPAQIPRHFASTTIGWRGANEDGTGVSTTLRYQGGQFEDDLNQRLLKTAFTVDARAGWRLSPAVLIEARAENLFDARVETAISGAGIIERSRPQTFWLGLRFNIG